MLLRYHAPTECSNRLRYDSANIGPSGAFRGQNRSMWAGLQDPKSGVGADHQNAATVREAAKRLGIP